MMNLKNNFGDKSYTDLKTSYDLSNSGDQNQILIKDLKKGRETYISWQRSVGRAQTGTLQYTHKISKTQGKNQNPTPRTCKSITAAKGKKVNNNRSLFSMSTKLTKENLVMQQY